MKDASWLSARLKLRGPGASPSSRTLSSETFDDYTRHLIEYDDGEGGWIPAYLLVPSGPSPFPAVLIHHQHNGERHLGKSEVVGLAGDPLQSFGVALARRGFVVLAPDSICFEDRRTNKRGLEPDEDPEADWLQHLNEMAYRMVRGDTLMRKVLDDATIGIDLLSELPFVDSRKIGLLGHSYGGNTVLFQAAIDERVTFACASGAACSYATKMKRGTGLELSLILPEIANELDVHDLVSSVAPRAMLLVSADGDKYSADADAIYEAALPHYSRAGAAEALTHYRYVGDHAITEERFEAIVSRFEEMKHQGAIE